MTKLNGFVAYPSAPASLGSVIRTAVESVNSTSTAIEFRTWEQNDVSGRPITAPILSGIEGSDIVVADVTKLNFNVTYEIGYAIGVRRRLRLVKNTPISGDDVTILKVGIFDTLGYSPYSNSEELSTLLSDTSDLSPLKVDQTIDTKSPLYMLETPARTPEMTRIVARVKRARLFYRSFTQSEDARLSATDAIHHVARSLGVLIPLLPPEFKDAVIHNTRAAFVAGLAHGMGKVVLVLHDGRHAVPLDLRDAADTYTSLNDINKHIQRFAGDVYEALQDSDTAPSASRTLLQEISLGDPMAENEFQSLGSYYVQTDEYNRALRGEVNLVVGRKGTGKTALFFQVRDRIRRDKQNVVIDLKPEGYQLLKLKEHVLDLLTEGAKTHLITAFWEYLLLLEISRKVLEKDRSKHRFDQTDSEAYRTLNRLHHDNVRFSEGDFSERLLQLSEELVHSYKAQFGREDQVRLTTDQVTNLLHLNEIASLRSALASYLEHKQQVLVLFDNLDKGWAFRGEVKGDILILCCLIDAARKTQRDMRKASVQMSCIVFVRNDIYELLMKSSPDFGKEARASLDWGDSDLLRELLRKRITKSMNESLSFGQAWGLICTSHYEGEETSQYLIDRCLMRPRHLLKLIGYCKSFAVNLDHSKIETDDIAKGLRSYSNDLVLEADRELTDVEPAAEGLLYQFVGEPSTISEENLHILMRIHDIDQARLVAVTDVLLYLGFLGIKIGDSDPRYIYDFGYDLGILRALQQKNRGVAVFVLNPAPWPALDVKVA